MSTKSCRQHLLSICCKSEFCFLFYENVFIWFTQKLWIWYCAPPPTPWTPHMEELRFRNQDSMDCNFVFWAYLCIFVTHSPSILIASNNIWYWISQLLSHFFFFLVFLYHLWCLFSSKLSSLVEITEKPSMEVQLPLSPLPSFRSSALQNPLSEVVVVPITLW